ncbi:Zinc finger, NHR/GATA-type [Penicillium digitatum]|uniref:Zinc finger, NHR/GATA-type n=1 Tax=Penicillium digitatum TaxID=36651 RepID=A0A7T6XTZ7_PENDI|nr:Zinc finger, NHR/GATA-type [Penicillium digitatum]
MGSLEAAPRHRDPLPAIGFLGKDGSGYTSRHPSSATASPTPLMSPNIMYSGQSLPYSYASNAPPGYISSPEARRALEDDKEKHTLRQSLPSIHEALGNDNPLPYPASTSAPPPQSAHPAPPSHLIGRPSAEGPAGPPNPFSNGPPTGPLMREPNFPHQARESLLHKVPKQGSLRVPSPNGYGHFPPNYSFQPQSGSHSYPPAHYDNRSYMGAPRVEEVKGGFVGRPGPPHSDTGKRHLDVYDVETSLNEIAELSTRTLDFSRHYAARAHQTQRSGPLLGSLPSLNEVEDMLHMQRRNQDALIRIRTAVVNQEQALAEQMAQRKAFKTEDDHMAMYQEDFKGTGGFAGADPKKRRGKAAPPGRCHSCNRAETPEWRRGPDGARTLCNACGLHYAKLTRKMGAHKAASLGSNLKPKSVLDSASPTSH